MRFFASLLALFLVAGCGDQEPTKNPPKPGNGTGQNTDERLGLLSPNGAFFVHANWTIEPKVDKEARVVLKFSNSLRQPAKKVTSVKVVPWMPSMGHGLVNGAVDDMEVRRVNGSNNEYEVSNLVFSMGGPWQLQVTAEVEDTKDTANVEVNVQ